MQLKVLAAPIISHIILFVYTLGMKGLYGGMNTIFWQKININMTNQDGLF